MFTQTAQNRGAAPGRRRRRAEPALAPVPSRVTKAASGSGAAAASLVLQTAQEKLPRGPGGRGVSPGAERAPGSAARPGAPCHFNEELRQHPCSSGAQSGVTVPMVPSNANSARLVYQRHVEMRI